MTATRMQLAYDRIRSKMLSGELPPGTRLVNRALGRELGLSTVTVREAIHRLTSEGLIEHIPNAGSYVRQLDRPGVAKLYAFREALERFALEQIARRIEPLQVRRLEQLCAEWRTVADQIRSEPEQRAVGPLFDQWWQCDVRFHATLIEAADNPWLSKTVRDLQLMSRIALTKSGTIEADAAGAIVREHADLVTALAGRDVDACLRWVAAHYRSALDEALAHVDRLARRDGAGA